MSRRFLASLEMTGERGQENDPFCSGENPCERPPVNGYHQADFAPLYKYSSAGLSAWLNIS